MINKKNSTTIIVAAVIILISFYGGFKYGQTKTATNKMAFNGQTLGGNFAGTAGGQIQRGGNRFMAGGGFTNGEIVSKDNQTLTIKMRDGGSKIILYSPSTEIGKFVSGTLSDLTTSTNVMITGKSNSDGSLTAQSIQIRPAMMPQPNNPGPQGNAQTEPAKPLQ
ncbi:MAG: hypothetical protein NTV81_03975 [Candidatus Komeilibacteria bacterium]|nr:hypothetical protein [Candidatus Komeilibacteria bacterium]